jgi:hypothetical protein
MDGAITVGFGEWVMGEIFSCLLWVVLSLTKSLGLFAPVSKSGAIAHLGHSFMFRLEEAKERVAQ